MMINRDERSFSLDSPLQNQRVISPRLASLLRAKNIMPCVAQQRGQFDSKHLIQVKAHGSYAAPRAVISVWRIECRAYSKTA